MQRYVRSPIGHENMAFYDWSPPKLPRLSPKAATRPATCLPLDRVSAVPGNPDLLLAIAKDGHLYGAFLPPLPPLQEGRSFDRPLDTGPGSGWLRVGDADSIDGDNGVPAPGADTSIANGSWQAGGAALVRVGTTEILLTPTGAFTLPPGTRPMAMGPPARAISGAPSATGWSSVPVAVACSIQACVRPSSPSRPGPRWI